ncbi:MAG: hypothetical protein HY210_02405 [Candidatus Omnitrophica bacterium]|nr:hypothetical protein [Candidatus Omnitrophota bacterium]
MVRRATDFSKESDLSLDFARDFLRGILIKVEGLTILNLFPLFCKNILNSTTNPPPKSLKFVLFGVAKGAGLWAVFIVTIPKET